MATGNPDDERDGLAEGLEETDDLEELYSGDYLRDCADQDARAERLAELRRRIEQRAYTVDADRIAEELLVRGLKS